jgi:hypothetical protein
MLSSKANSSRPHKGSQLTKIRGWWPLFTYPTARVSHRVYLIVPFLHNTWHGGSKQRSRKVRCTSTFTSSLATGDSLIFSRIPKVSCLSRLNKFPTFWPCSLPMLLAAILDASILLLLILPCISRAFRWILRWERISWRRWVRSHEHQHPGGVR